MASLASGLGMVRASKVDEALGARRAGDGVAAAPERYRSTAQSQSLMQFECTNECRFGCTASRRMVSTLHTAESEKIGLASDILLRSKGPAWVRMDG